MESFASLDHQPIAIKEYQGVFRSVFLPPGNHQVEFFYRQPLLPAGLLLSLTTLLIVLFLITKPHYGTKTPSFG